MTTEFQSALDRLVRWLRWRRRARIAVMALSVFLCVLVAAHMVVWFASHALATRMAWYFDDIRFAVALALAAAAFAAFVVGRKSPRPGRGEAALFAEAWGPARGATPLAAFGRQEAPILREALHTLRMVERDRATPTLGFTRCLCLALSLLVCVIGFALTPQSIQASPPQTASAVGLRTTETSNAMLVAAQERHQALRASMLAELRAQLLAVSEQERQDALTRYRELWAERSRAAAAAEMAVESGRKALASDASALKQAARDQARAVSALRASGADLGNFQTVEEQDIDAAKLKAQTDALTGLVHAERQKSDIAHSLSHTAHDDPRAMLDNIDTVRPSSGTRNADPASIDSGTEGLLHMDASAWKDTTPQLAPRRLTRRQAAIIARYVSATAEDEGEGEGR